MNDSDHIEVLDALRGFLAFWVFYGHIKKLCVGSLVTWGSTSIAVDGFMLLSGFLMAYNWQSRKNRSSSLKAQVADFYLRRFFRIAPLYYILVTVAFLGQDYFFDARNLAASTVQSQYLAVKMPARITLDNILSHYTFTFGLLPQFASSTALPDWSISLEMQFYLVFPLLFFVIARYRSIPLFILLTCISVVSYGMSGGFQYPSFILFRLNIFAAGICIALAYSHKTSAKCVPWLIFALIPLLVTAIQLKIIAIFMISALFIKNDALIKMCSGRIVKFFSETSYAVYLLHLLITYPVLALLFKCGWFTSLGNHMKMFLSLSIIGMPTYSLAFLLYRLIEVPGIKLGKRAVNKLSESRRNYVTIKTIG